MKFESSSLILDLRFLVMYWWHVRLQWDDALSNTDRYIRVSVIMTFEIHGLILSMAYWRKILINVRRRLCSDIWGSDIGKIFVYAWSNCL